MIHKLFAEKPNIDFIGWRWLPISCSLLILRDLLERPQRFGDLQISLAGVSSRTLSNKLKRLEKEKLVQRKQFNYTLTKKGAALQDIVEAMRKYGKKYL